MNSPRKFLNKHPKIRSPYQKAPELLELDPRHPSLRPYRLQARLSPRSSVSINVSYRIVLEILIRDNDITLIDIGHHDHVSAF